MRVLTYNIQQGYSTDGRRAYAGQLEVIRSLKPDLVGLQESDVARFSGGNADIVRTFSEGLGMYAYYGPKTVTGTFGIALLSRYPLQNPRTFFMYSAGEQTAAIQAEITVNGKTYQILVTHLGNDGPIIQQQQVLARLTGLQNVIAMGDFNFDQTTEQYALTDANVGRRLGFGGFAACGGFGYGPFDRPYLRLTRDECAVGAVYCFSGLRPSGFAGRNRPLNLIKTNVITVID